MLDLFDDILYRARSEPDKFFGGRKSLAIVANFIYGFIAARRDTEIGLDDRITKFNACPNGFDDFVSKRLGLSMSRPWYINIEYSSNSDDYAFELFYKLLDEFFDENKE